jgi:hypothetical protein
MIVAMRWPSSTTALESRHSSISCTEKTFVVIDLANAGKAAMIHGNGIQRTARMTEQTSNPAGVEVGDSTYEAMRAKVAGSNLDPQTFLATDYLNHFNEVVMLIEMIPDMPEILEDAKEWRPKAYKDHFRDSTIADREIAIEAYDAVPDVYKTSFEKTVDQINTTIATAISALERDLELGNPDLVRENATALSRVIQRLMDTASAIIHGSAATLDQSEIDDLLGS